MEHHLTRTSIIGDFIILLLGYLAILTTALLRGGHGKKSVIGIDTCSLPSWIIFIGGNLACFLCTCIAFNKHSLRLVRGDNPEEASTPR